MLFYISTLFPYPTAFPPLSATSCNWLGGHASALAMQWHGAKRLAKKPFKNMTIDGVPVAAIQNVDNFSFA